MKVARALIGISLFLPFLMSPVAAQGPPLASWNNPPEESLPGIEHRTFESEAIGETVGYNVLVPPGYENGADRYPVLYWLHGGGGSEARDARRIGPRIRRTMLEDQVPEMVVVFPNGGPRSFYVDAADGSLPAETMIVEELLPEIEHLYRVRTDRDGRALEGASMGGFGALRLAFKYPDQFSSVVAYAPALLDLVEKSDGTMTLTMPGATLPSGMKQRLGGIFQEVFGGSVEAWLSRSPWELARANAPRIRDRVGIRVVIGSDDGISPERIRAQGNPDGLVPANRLFSDHLEELNIDHVFEIVEGVGHDPAPLYDRVGLQGLRFHADHGRW